MKTTMTKKLSLLILLSSVLLLSSCLDMSRGSWMGKEEYSYIVKDEKTSTIYARTASGHWITSEKISTLTPGTTARISYQINFDEAEEILTGEKNNVSIWKATLGAEPIILNQTRLYVTDAPDAPVVNFETLTEPLFIENDYFGDNWLFPYIVKMKKGQTSHVSFYKANEIDPNEQSGYKVEVIIDVRVEITGTPEAGAEDKLVGDEIVVNLSDLRYMYANNTDSSGKIDLKFRYYRSDKDDKYTTNRDYAMYIEQK